jgi:hypothetical protein
MIARTVFAAGAATAAWTVAGYPLALAALPARPVRGGAFLPTVTVVVPAYREHEALPRKLAALAALDYPADRLSLVVAIDGDAELADLARRATPSARVVLLPERRGKPTALNAALAHATGEVVLLTDAHTPLAPDALRHAVRHLGDPTVHAVSGRWATAGGLYARYEDLLLRLESRSGSVAGAFGAFFLVRRARMPVFPADVVNDDLWLLLHLLGGGGRVVYEPAAGAEEPPMAPGDELERRRRIGAGRVGLARQVRALPARSAWRVGSHKLGRLALPVALAGTLGSSLVLVRRPVYRAAAAAQLAVGVVGALSAAGIEPPGPLRTPARGARELTLAVVATGGGIVRALRGGQGVLWTAVR